MDAFCKFLHVWWFSQPREAECHFVSGDAEHPTLGARVWHCRSPAVSAGACVEQNLGLMCWASKGRGCLERILAVPSYLCSMSSKKCFPSVSASSVPVEFSQSFLHLTQILFGPRCVSSRGKEILSSENLGDVLVF